MNITRHHYEEYFLLYVDNELNAADRKAVDNFVQQNPDLEEELVMLQQSVIHPDQHLVFDNKESLLKHTPVTNPVNETNYEEYFVLYGDDELTNEQKDLVEQFVYKHPQHQAAFELIQQVRLTPDPQVLFPDKESLYRHEHDEKVIPIRWWRIVAAAVVLLFLGGLSWFTLVRTDKPAVNNPEMAGTVNPDTMVPQKERPPSITDQRKQEAPALAAADDAHKVAPAIDINSTAHTTNAVKESTRPVNQQAREATTIASTTVPEKIIEAASNTTAITSVTLTENVVKPVEKAETGKISVDAHTATALVNNNNNTAVAAAEGLMPNDETEQDQFTTTTNKKNKMRGFFRKVSRVFERTTNMEPGENSRGGIRIANFEIALK